MTVPLTAEGTLARPRSGTFPWILALSAADRVTCSRDLTGADRASFSTSRLHLATGEFGPRTETASAPVLTATRGLAARYRERQQAREVPALLRIASVLVSPLSYATVARMHVDCLSFEPLFAN